MTIRPVLLEKLKRNIYLSKFYPTLYLKEAMTQIHLILIFLIPNKTKIDTQSRPIAKYIFML